MKYYYCKNKENRELVAELDARVAHYEPPLWARNPHLQILWSIYTDMVAAAVPPERSDELFLADGGSVTIDWW